MCRSGVVVRQAVLSDRAERTLTFIPVELDLSDRAGPGTSHVISHRRPITGGHRIRTDGPSAPASEGITALPATGWHDGGCSGGQGVAGSNPVSPTEYLQARGRFRDERGRPLAVRVGPNLTRLSQIAPVLYRSTARGLAFEVRVSRGVSCLVLRARRFAGRPTCGRVGCSPLPGRCSLMLVRTRGSRPASVARAGTSIFTPAQALRSSRRQG